MRDTYGLVRDTNGLWLSPAENEPVSVTDAEVTQVLEDACLWLQADDSNWCQGSPRLYAHEGDKYESGYYRVVSRCARGAIADAAWDLFTNVKADNAAALAEERLALVLVAQSDDIPRSACAIAEIEHWNDAIRTTREDVILAFKEAIG